MRTKVTLIIAAIVLSFNVGFAQQDEDCMLDLTMMNDNAKNQNYDAAYEPFMKVRKECPKFNYAIYFYGDKILKHKIENSSGAEQVAFLKDLMKVWDEGQANYESKYTVGGVLQNKAQLMYDYKTELGLSDQDVYDAFDKLYKTDVENFTSPKALYTYFSLMVDLYDGKQKEAQQMFDKYDDINEKIASEIENYTQKVNLLVEKEEAGQELTSKEEKSRSSFNSYLDAYDKISSSIDSKLGQRANCEVLIPLYSRDFETYRNDAVWLKRAVNRMYSKECTDDALYIKLVRAYDETSPSADTKVFVAGLLLKDGKESEAIKYFNEAYNLEKDAFKKAKLAMRIGDNMKKRGNLGQARTYYRNALANSPSMGRAHINIAQMYASSANSCGDSHFNKRAVFWLAAAEARKAGRVDANLKSYADQLAASYDGQAPQKSEIFQAGNEGQTISIGCWIGQSVTVPKL